MGAVRHPHPRHHGRLRPGHRLLWSEQGELLATASQSIAVRLWREDAVLPEPTGGEVARPCGNGETRGVVAE